MIGIVSCTITICILSVQIPVLVKVGGIWSRICGLGSGVRVKVMGLGIFSVLFVLFVNLSIAIFCVHVKIMY